MKSSTNVSHLSNNGKIHKCLGKKQSYAIYVNKILKQVDKNRSISWKAMEIMNYFINDIFDRCAAEASRVTKFSSKRTMTAKEIRTAVKLILPRNLGHHAIIEGNNALFKYTRGPLRAPFESS